MKSSVETLEPTKVKLVVSVPFDEFKPAIDRAAKEIGKQVSIPGFRQGHVPARVLEARFGRGAIVQEAVNNSLDGYYSQAVNENSVVPLGRPEVEVTQVPVEPGDKSDFEFTVTVDVRPHIVLPDPAGITLEVEPSTVSDEDVEERLTALRERFGSLKDVDRPAQDGDSLTIDMSAEINGEQIDSVTGVSYQIGSGIMLPGMDENLTGMAKGETKTFTDTLAGGEHEGEEAQVTVTVHAVKESELPEADDDFAQMASEFDTIDELREDLRAQVAKDKLTDQVYAARELLLEELRKTVEVPLPQAVVEAEIAAHLEREGKDADDPHAAEVREEVPALMKDQLMLDVLAELFELQVEQNELLNFMFEQAQAYGIEPNQFIQAAAQSNQISAFAGELLRGKALISALRLAKVVDTKGNKIDVTEVLGEAPEDAVVPDFAAQGEAPVASAPAQAPAEEEEAGEAFDPSAHKVDEVLAYVANVSAEEKARVLEAEKAGKARKTLVEKLQG